MNKIALILFITLVSCAQDVDPSIKVEKVNISILNPVFNQMVAAGDTVAISIEVNALIELHGYELEIVKKGNNQSVYSQHVHEDGIAYSIQKDWINQLDSTSDLRLFVRCFASHDSGDPNGTYEKSVDFTAHAL